MRDLQKILTEIDRSSLSSITEVETHLELSGEEFRKQIKGQVEIFSHVYKLEPGHSVLLKKANSISFFVDFLALYFLGIAAVPIDPNLKEFEIEKIINAIAPSLLIEDKLTRKFYNSPKAEFIGMALILFTSGTTSDPKGVLISRQALEKKFDVLQNYIDQNEIERTLCFVPTFFGHGLICNSLFPIFRGQHFFIAQKMTIELAQKLGTILDSYRISFFSSVPSHWEVIFEFGHKPQKNFLRRVHTASSPLVDNLAQKIKSWSGIENLYDVYGATEMLGWFASRRILLGQSLGRFDEMWQVEAQTNQESELLLSSDYMFSGYWENHLFVKKSLFYSGDVFIDGYIKGRIKNTINKNGVKIFAEDISNALLKSEIVSEAIVFPVEDVFSGQRAVAYVVLAGQQTLEDLWQYCLHNLSDVMTPSELISVDNIPKNARGKVSQVELSQRHDPASEFIQDELLAVFNQVFHLKYKKIDIERSLLPQWDSIRHAELIIAIQNKFKIKFSVKDIVHLKNLKQFEKLIIDARLKILQQS